MSLCRKCGGPVKNGHCRRCGPQSGPRLIEQIEYLSAEVLELARAQRKALAAVFDARVRLFAALREMHQW